VTGDQPPPDKDYVIQPANWRDVGELRRLEQICFPKDAWPLWDLVAALTFPDAVRLKAIHAERMIGFIGGDIRRSESVGWVTTVGVLPEYRRDGIGTALLHACEEKMDMPRVRLSVRRSNSPAIALYLKEGYHEYGVWPRYYIDGEDALVLEKVRG
jgi:ribosomal protein S18 acetylase RimI-like enzyme